MRNGHTLAERFVVEELAGSGGMGKVYRALDRNTGQPVAVKVLHGPRGSNVVRFEREARLLSELEHPLVVRYVAHGTLATGEPYLVMEWLDGEDLATRLARERLAPADSMALALAVAEALGALHERGIVHRDLKPSNIFLVDGSVHRIKLVDLGLAHIEASARMTETGLLLGTVAYMAPEQARGAAELDARVDVFALGCVLFECLTGEQPFSAVHATAILTKILFEDTPRLGERLPGAPGELDALLARMLSKQPDSRPRDGRAAAAALRELGEMHLFAGGTAKMSELPRPSALTDSEQQAVAVILIDVPRLAVAREFARTEVTPEPTRLESLAPLAAAAAEHGGRLQRLLHGSAAVLLSGVPVATDLAAQAARCALAMARHAPGRQIALAMGRSELAGRLPVGPAIDRAARLLANHAAAQAAQHVLVTLDEATVGLLDARFMVHEEGGVFVLRGERDLAEVRTLLGKPTPCVGRDRELRMLEGLFDDCLGSGRAHAVLVTAPPGVGKSRLGWEFLQKVRQRGEPTAIWSARGEPLRSGSAFAVLAGLIQSACGLRGGEPLEVRQRRLEACVAERIGEDERQRVTEFLGEIIGAPFSDADSAPLRAARQDAQLMSEEMRAAFLDLLAAECETRPVVLLLEDLHWSDGSTLRSLDGALRDLEEKPLFVLALARPEIHELFPRLWAGRPVQEIRLRVLPRKAAELLVQHVLGEHAGPDTCERIVRLAEGNAFYLEELIRATAEGKGHDLPETLVAMVQSRLGALDEERRRVLRAASIFGETFWRGGVEALLGANVRPAELDAWLAVLDEREIIVRPGGARFPGEPDFAFRHILLRDGAYALLTDADRALGHRLAGAWLEAAGESDAMLLGSHYERGEDIERAMSWYLVAAEQAFERDDLDAAALATRRGMAMSQPATTEQGAPPHPVQVTLRALGRVEALIEVRRQEIATGVPRLALATEPESAYRFAFIPGARVFHVTCSGRWSKAFARQYVDDFKVTVQPLLGRPWGKLINLDAWLPTEPDAAEAIIDFLRWAISEQMVRIAYVLSNSTRRLQARRIIETANADVISEFFATEDEGLAWLRQNGL